MGHRRGPVFGDPRSDRSFRLSIDRNLFLSYSQRDNGVNSNSCISGLDGTEGGDSRC